MKVSHRRLGALGLIVALAAAAGLLFVTHHGGDEPDPPARAALTTVWPDAQRADLPGNLPDGPVYHPGLFLDARTAIGTAPAPDGTALRLVVRAADGALRELRRLPLDGNPAVRHVHGGRRRRWSGPSRRDGRTARGLGGEPTTGDGGPAAHLGHRQRRSSTAPSGTW